MGWGGGLRLKVSAFSFILPSPLRDGLLVVAQAWKGKVCGRGLWNVTEGEDGGNQGKEAAYWKYRQDRQVEKL